MGPPLCLKILLKLFRSTCLATLAPQSPPRALLPPGLTPGLKSQQDEECECPWGPRTQLAATSGTGRGPGLGPVGWARGWSRKEMVQSTWERVSVVAHELGPHTLQGPWEAPLNAAGTPLRSAESDGPHWMRWSPQGCQARLWGRVRRSAGGHAGRIHYIRLENPVGPLFCGD